ncbi:alpha-L-fucosidase [Neorhodopirellula lusitana]|uniref:alpha-L-fucosidase n=2 Tax=Neorhodopirellula lusitana TaxID=445327 RepID=A0ABY1QRW7_9BACT|nr:alpha-L-fucosidase [Neorhodopirellula lusitana]
MFRRFVAWGLMIALGLVIALGSNAACMAQEEFLEDVIKQANAADDTGKVGELDNKPERLEWLRDNGFGMFLHWGVDAQLGSVISHTLVGASDDYVQRYVTELPKTFYPKKWDAEEYVLLAKSCGMKYIALTTKHHSGFCLWDTKTTDFNVMNTPYGKDIVREFVDACHQHGLAVGLYYSPEDFLYAYKHGELIKRRPHRPSPDSDPEYVKFVQAQVTELMANYGDINVFFIDGRGKKTTKEVVWTLQPDCLITRGAIESPEQTVPGQPPEEVWETCMTLGTQWQYKPQQLDTLKDGDRVVEILIETRAKGGALLLNLGPRPDGFINELQEDIMREVALWNFVNREAVIDVRPWIVTNEENIWFTRNKDEDTVYVFLTRQKNWDRKDRREFVIGSVSATEDTTMTVLGHNGQVVEYTGWEPEKAAPLFEQKEDGLHLSLVPGQRLLNSGAWRNPVVVKLTNVKPSCKPPLVVNGKAKGKDGQIAFQGELKDLGDADEVLVGFEYQEYLGFAENMYNDEWTATELVKMGKPGAFTDTVKVPGNKTYQWRAVVKHPRLKMTGDHSKVSVK